MQEQYYYIGEAAGKIFQTLSSEGELTFSKLKKAVGTSDDALIYQALGWLAREEKISFVKSARSLKISLAEVCA